MDGFGFRDGRINRLDLAAPFAIYPYTEVGGGTGIIFYDTYNLNNILLTVSADDIAAVDALPAENTLIAESTDGRVALYRLAGGLFQAMGPSENGKTYTFIFESISATLDRVGFEE